MSVPPRVRCRQIEETDLEAVAALLTRGFPLHERSEWQRALERLRAHAGAPNLPRFGYLLDCGGAPVGVILTICSSRPRGEGSAVRCNLSSWFVEPNYRTYAPLLISNVLAHKNVDFVNVSPAAHTEPIIEAQGFARYNEGQFVAVPALAPSSEARAVRIIGGGDVPDAAHDPADIGLMRAHASYGCITLWCVTAQRAHPFVLQPRLVKGVLPGTALIYCSDLDDFVRFARPVGRHLLMQGRLFVIIDAVGPIESLPGRFFHGKRRKYYRGTRPRLGDLSYTEIPMFGT
jgi:hypothetical protein